MNLMCPYCEKISPVKIKTPPEKRRVKNTEVTAIVFYTECSVCKKEFMTPDQMDKSLKNAFTKYREIHNIITSEEIVNIRSKYNISQKAFAKLLGFGELTINSYENGTIPTKVSSNLIRLVNNSNNFAILFEENKNKLTLLQRTKIEKILILN